MLFNSFQFLLVFLPLALIGFYAVAAFSRLWLALVWLVVSSLVFHAYWKASYTWLFVGSITANYAIGWLCLQGGPLRSALHRKLALIGGITFNLGLLAYFKYASFIAEFVWQTSGFFVDLGRITLPLAISFY